MMSEHRSKPLFWVIDFGAFAQIGPPPAKGTVGNDMVIAFGHQDHLAPVFGTIHNSRDKSDFWKDISHGLDLLQNILFILGLIEK